MLLVDNIEHSGWIARTQKRHEENERLQFCDEHHCYWRREMLELSVVHCIPADAAVTRLCHSLLEALQKQNDVV